MKLHMRGLCHQQSIRPGTAEWRNRFFGKRRSRGQALVEFGLLVPLIVLILVGVLDLGHVFFSYEEVINASREAARYCALNYKTSPDMTAIVENELNLGSLPSGSSVSTSPTCNSSLIPGQAVTVTVSMPVDAPFIGPLLGQSGGKITVSANGTMMVQGGI